MARKKPRGFGGPIEGLGLRPLRFRAVGEAVGRQALAARSLANASSARAPMTPSRSAASSCSPRANRIAGWAQRVWAACRDHLDRTRGPIGGGKREVRQHPCLADVTDALQRAHHLVDKFRRLIASLRLVEAACPDRGRRMDHARSPTSRAWSRATAESSSAAATSASANRSSARTERHKVSMKCGDVGNSAMNASSSARAPGHAPMR